MLLNKLARTWWMPLMRGVFAIIFGLFALFAPAETLLMLILVFGIYALANGVLTIYQAVRRHQTGSAFGIVEGVVGIVAGILAFLIPVITGLTLLVVIGVWAVTTGIMQIATAWQLRDVLDDEIFQGIGGVMSLVFGLLIFFNPFGSALAITWLVGLYALIFGALLVGAALHLKEIHDDLPRDRFDDTIPV